MKKVRTIITSDWYNALYVDGVLKHEAEPDYLHGETMATLFPDASYYGVQYTDYDELIGNHDGYPHLLEDFRLDLCTRYR